MEKKIRSEVIEELKETNVWTQWIEKWIEVRSVVPDPAGTTVLTLVQSRATMGIFRLYRFCKIKDDPDTAFWKMMEDKTFTNPWDLGVHLLGLIPKYYHYGHHDGHMTPSKEVGPGWEGHFNFFNWDGSDHPDKPQ